MKLDARDKEALVMTCNCIRNCKHYNTVPAPYFGLLVRMYKELERLGEIEWEEGVSCDVRPYQ